MDKKLHLLDSFEAQGTDGASYKVMAYEHLLRVDLVADGQDHWESTGLSEYRLGSGERVDVAPEWRENERVLDDLGIAAGRRKGTARLGRRSAPRRR